MRGQQERVQGTMEGQFHSSRSSAGFGPEETGVGSRRGEKLWKEIRVLTRMWARLLRI